MNSSTLTFGALAIIVGIVLFRVKYEVVTLELQRSRIQKSINETRESIHVLHAEWAHLNDPKRIQNLAVKYLNNIQPLKNTQMVTFHDAAGGDKGYDKQALEELIEAAASENMKHQEVE